ncbi:hypothetical protein BB560_000495 [Smittium megazygosporum]|uniref:Uncharacterized protein n=1 Tax=Smittium megazygosporum TaxID=133381 RepID=A0A2T9ZK66_9FUNG|nr:hypothetical protein BB560_000495 [Smittium megazygosporum]
MEDNGEKAWQTFEKIRLEKKLDDADKRREEIQSHIVEKNKAHMDHVFAVSDEYHSNKKSPEELEFEMEVDAKLAAADERREQHLRDISSHNHEKVAHAKRVSREHH